jgi:hypothetical protein
MNNVNWEYSEENRLWSLHVNGLYMGVFDTYDYHKQRKILYALETTQQRKLEVVANGHNIDAVILREINPGDCIVLAQDRVGRATRTSLEDNIWTLAPVEQCIDLLSM